MGAVVADAYSANRIEQKNNGIFFSVQDLLNLGKSTKKDKTYDASLEWF